MITPDERLELEQVHQQLKAMRQVVDGLEKSLAPLWHKLFEMEKEVQDRLVTECRPVQVQTSGPQCKSCGAFTTKTRVQSHGLCMKCELRGEVPYQGEHGLEAHREG